MDFFWIVATILIIVLLHFMMSAAFGFNLLFKICQQVFVWVRGEEYMEEVRWKSYFYFAKIYHGLFIQILITKQDKSVAAAVVIVHIYIM